MKLKDYNVILASGSPRRIQMLKEQGVAAQIIKPQCDEHLAMDLPVTSMVMAISMKKGRWVLDQICTDCNNDPPRLLIASDTVVYCDEVMGKPADAQDAFRMLTKLRGRVHSVISGVYLNFIDEGKQLLLFDETKVFVKNAPDQWIRDYIAGGEPMDKAGAYAIQGQFGEMIDHIEGNYDNVVGFPLQKIAALFPGLEIK